MKSWIKIQWRNYLIFNGFNFSTTIKFPKDNKILNKVTYNLQSRTPSRFKIPRGKNRVNTLLRERASSGRSKNRYGYTKERLREALLYVDIRTYRTTGGCQCACRKSWAWRWFTSAPSRTCLIKQKCRLPHEDRWGRMDKENRCRRR